MQRTVTFLLLLLVVHKPFCSAAPIITAFGGHCGPAKTSLARDNTLALGVHASLLGGLPGFVLRPYLDFWQLQFDKKSNEHWHWRLFAVGLSALKPINLNNSKAVPYVGGGLAVHLNDWTISDVHSASGSHAYEIDLSLHAIAGLELPLKAHLNGFIEFKYALAGVSDYFALWLGMRYNLT